MNLDFFEIKFKQDVVGVTPPTGGVWGTTPKTIFFSEFNPISCNLLLSEIIFLTFLKPIFLGNLEVNLECGRGNHFHWGKGRGYRGATPRRIFENQTLFPAI